MLCVSVLCLWWENKDSEKDDHGSNSWTAEGSPWFALALPKVWFWGDIPCNGRYYCLWELILCILISASKILNILTWLVRWLTKLDRCFIYILHKITIISFFRSSCNNPSIRSSTSWIPTWRGPRTDCQWTNNRNRHDSRTSLFKNWETIRSESNAWI